MNGLALPMGDRLLKAVEKWLLRWYDRAEDDRAESRTAAAVATEERKAKRTERIRLRAIATRKRAEVVRETIIEEYRLASKAANRAGDRLIDETRRAGDGR